MEQRCKVQSTPQNVVTPLFWLRVPRTVETSLSLRPVTNSGWIEIQSSALNSLPSPGNRVGPLNVSSMPTITTPNTAPAIAFQQKANHWRLMGLEITTSYVSTSATVYNLILSGQDGSGNQISSASLLPSYIVLDRSYLHGLSTTNTTRGMDMDGAYVAVVDSYCDEIHSNGNDAQCFASWNGTGPFLIQNNFIQASTENILFGGANVSIANLNPSDITVVGNLIQKNTAWKGQAAPYNWSVKNLFELKTGVRVLIDGNVFQYDWLAAQGFSILLRSVNSGSTVPGSGGSCSWCAVQEVTFTHNIIQHVPSGIQMAASDSGFPPAQATARILIQNNLLTDVSSLSWGGHGWVYEISSNTVYAISDLTIDHNTSFPDSTNGDVLTLGDTGG